MSRKILLGLTTTSGSDWKEKVEECKKFDIKEIALFPTAINSEKRKELYGLLENSPVKSIPHVHLRDDMELWEMEYLKKIFGTQVFNIHNKNCTHNFSDFNERSGGYKNKIYVENLEKSETIPDPNELEDFAGLCVDFSHWEDGIMLGEKDYDQKMREVVGKFPVGCSHISAVSEKMVETRDAAFPEIIYRDYSKHFFENLSEFDYLKKYVQFIPELVSLELENSFEEQLKAKEYIEKIIQ